MGDHEDNGGDGTRDSRAARGLDADMKGEPGGSAGGGGSTSVRSLPSFIDFEASGIGPESYPLEVAWSRPDGSVHDCLIRPVAEWVHWDPNAHDVHGIDRQTAVREGLPVERVAMRLNVELGPCQVAYSDASAMDHFWCEVLFDAAGVLPEFRVASVLEALPGISVTEFERCREAAYKRLDGRRHRARTDVQALAMACRMASSTPAGE